jgi:histidine kinase
MFKFIRNLRHSLVTNLIVTVGLTLLASIATWAYFSVTYQKERLKGEVAIGSDRLSNTIRLGTHYAMMLNSRDDINQIINNIARQKEIKNIRIYNKDGQIKFSNQAEELDQKTNIKAEACDICHRAEPPMVSVNLEQRTRIFSSPDGFRQIGIISPIYNDPGCSTSDCHFHPEDKKILGALDVVVSLEDVDREIIFFEKGLFGLALTLFIITSAIIFVFVFRFVKQPINRLMEGTRRIYQGDYSSKIEINTNNEVGQLARVINQMSHEIGQKQSELNRQRDEYQTLFEMVPCFITVQDRDYRLMRYNRKFAQSFDPREGDYCYRVYKGRDEKCEICPVERTFEDGFSHTSEETGVGKDGKPTHWLVQTSPIRNPDGEIVAAMEMNLDITARKKLEEKLEKSEKKYHAIFNNIPNPVFVLDKDSFEVLDCNDSVEVVYGCKKEHITTKSFLEFFPEEDRERIAVKLKSTSIINQVKQHTNDGHTLFVNIRISPSEYPGKKVLLVTTSDITKRLEAEQQLIQASKMATLGEMATGVAHELNQPLSVIKTASNFFIRKVRKQEPIKEDILETMAEEIDSHVDRASKIINHLREFGRKSDLGLQSVQINQVIRKTFDMFSQQLKVRGIDTIWSLQDDLPEIRSDADRLEQVFINLLINARDAIMDRLEKEDQLTSDKRIFLRTRSERNNVIIDVCDTGIGIPPPIVDRIFEPFFTTKDVGRGTGLGLSISYGIIKDFGGNIRVKKNDPIGTCFIINFPIQKHETEELNTTND